MEMKLKIHSNIPNQLITDYSYIFAPFFELIRDRVACFALFLELEM